MQVVAEDVIAQLAEISTHDLVEVLGHRLNVAATGTGKLELTFNDGEWVGSNYLEKVKVFPQQCICRRDRRLAACPVHGRDAAQR